MALATTTDPDLKTEALTVLQAAWKALRRLEDFTDDTTESKAANRAVAFLDKAFAELERGKVTGPTSNRRNGSEAAAAVVVASDAVPFVTGSR